MIGLVYEKIVQPNVFERSAKDAEIAHEWGIQQLRKLQESPRLLAWARRFLTYEHSMLKTRVFGVNFPNPLGLAAGFDKYCEVSHVAVPACGFGFSEIGGITCHAQGGDPRPRLQRNAEL